MPQVQTEYGPMKAESDEVTAFKKKVGEVFSKPDCKCPCNSNDYEVVHPNAPLVREPVEVNCKCCGRKNYFDLERLTKFVEERLK